MNLITLNIWGGIIYKPLISFLKDQSSEVDIFCFQEVFDTQSRRKVSHGARVNILQEIKTVLKDFDCFYLAAEHGLDYAGPVDFDISWGLAIFVRNTLQVMDKGFISVYKGRAVIDGSHHSSMPRNLQYVKVICHKQELLIANLHGFWASGSNKLDTPERIDQSKIIKEFFDSTNLPKILCGDFNLSLNTNSLLMLEAGMINLVKEHHITSTRSHHYKKPEKHADYILVSPEIQMHSFLVLEDVVSDHLPLWLEFE